MTLIFLTFLTAFGIEALGTYVSIIGLSTLFGTNPIIMAIAIALDVGKLLVVSLLYTHWKRLSFLMKSYALIASVVTMTITSAGAMGYLSGEFQKAIMGSQENTLRVDVLKTEQAKLEERKKQIDKQIAELPKNYSNARIKLMKEFSDEQKQVTNRLTQINTDLPTLQIAQIGVEAKVGPILYISKAFDVPVEVAVKWVILMIIFVFDPLAVFLIIAGNFLLHLRRVHKDASISEADLFEEPKNSFEEVSAAKRAAAAVSIYEEPPPKPEAREAAPAPIFEVLRPTTPVHEGPMAKTFDDAPYVREHIGAEEMHEGPMVKTHDDANTEHPYIGSEDPMPPVPEVPAAPPVVPEAREIITREQLQPPAYFSSLGAVKADESVTFDDTPARDDAISVQYKNLK